MESVKSFFDRVIYILKCNRKIRVLCCLVAMLLVLTVVLGIADRTTAVATVSNFNKLVGKLEFVLGGEIAGIKILSNGVLVIGVDDILTGLREGDIILKLNDTNVESNQDIIDLVNMEENIKAGKVKALISRDNKNFTKDIKLKYSESTKKYELGLWVKDSSAGIGTITFYEKDTGRYAALGHGITETRENVIVPITGGAIVRASIEGIKKGAPKEAGDIKGVIYKEVIGQIYKNTLSGIYGKLENIETLQNKEQIGVMPKHEIKEEKAYIYCTLDNNKVEKYEIMINSVLLDSTGNKNMIIQVTDKTLIEKTGGIVQGMSGSPIVQDGKLVGAVTHVFLNEPTKGYAVFVENMIQDLLTVQ